MENSRNYVYIVRCADGTLYTGWTCDLDRRLRAHNEGAGAKYTRARRPVCLVYCKQCASRGDAMRREAEIKRMSRREKLELIKNMPEVAQGQGSSCLETTIDFEDGQGES